MNFQKTGEILDKIQAPFFFNYKGLDGLCYLAIVKKKNLFFDSFIIEIGYNETKISGEKIREIKDLIKELGSYEENVFWKRGFLRHKIKFPKVSSKSVKEKIYSNKKKENNINKESDIYKRYRIKKLGSTAGSIGCVFSSKIDNKKKFFLITNQHVTKGNISDSVFNGNDKLIGKIIWFKYNDDVDKIGEYDVSIVEIENNTLKPLTNDNPEGHNYDFNHNEIEEPNLNLNESKIRGGKSDWEDATLYSLKAFVKINNYWYQNQILFNCRYLSDGDSGSTFVNKKNNNIVGLYIGQTYFSSENGNLRIANNIYNLFNGLNTYQDKPRIKIEKFY